jgi:N-acetylneuraminic acid mutarotase
MRSKNTKQAVALILSCAITFLAQSLHAIDEWANRTSAAIPGRALHRAVWTGEQMIVWGGEGFGVSYASGARFLAKSNTWTAVSTVNEPVNRSVHTSVWTGTEMIVWGGYNGTLLQSGGRYNPTTDTWQPTSTTGAPSARINPGSVWTGTEMIIWGGSNVGSTAYGDGALYNPTTDTWRPMSQTGAPSARGGCVTVWTGTEMVVWGGGNGSGMLGDGAIYNPATDTWRPMTGVNAPAARGWIFQFIWTGTEMIVWGGAGNTLNDSYGDGARYNPATDTWTPMNNTGAPSARNRMALAWTGKELVVFGGATGHAEGTYVNTGARYNPMTDSWAPMTLTDAPSARVHHTAVWTGASVLFFGGYLGSGHGNDCYSYSPEFGFATIQPAWLSEYFGSDYRHNPAALETADADGDTFNNLAEFTGASDPTSASSLPSSGEWLKRADNTVIPGRSIYASAWSGKELLVWGGEGLGVNYGNGARYSPASNSWTIMSSVNAPQNRSHLVSVWTGSKFIVWGGYNGSYVNTGGRYDPATDTWQATTTSGAPTPRSFPAAVWTGTEMIIWGGANATTYFTNGAIYNPVSNTWRPMSDTGKPSARALPAHVWTGTELLVWGGSDSSGANGTGGAYNPTTDTWRPISTVNAPSPRTWMFQSSVWTGTEMIVWGGANSGLTQTYGDGARYNPTTDTWTTMSTIDAPQARNRFAMAWTGKEVFIFGGAFNSSAPMNDGARYNPQTDSWIALPTTGAPSARVHHYAVWNGVSMMVYGGYTGSVHSQEIYSFSPAAVAGLPKSWLDEFFGVNHRHDPRSLSGADPDNDGSTNLKEYEKGSDPLDALSGFVAMLQMTPTVSWNSVPGASYRILRKANINDANWTVVNASFTATATQSIYFDLTSNSNSGFYMVEPLPVAP